MDKNQKETLFKTEFIELYAELDYKLLLDKTAEKIKNYLDCEGAAFFLYDPLKQQLHFEVATGSKSDALKTITIRKGEGIAGWIAEKEESVLINDCEKDERFTSKTDKKVDFKTKSILGVPVMRGDQLLCVIEAINKNDDQFTDSDLDLLNYIGSFIAIPMHNALLFKKMTQETRNKEQLIELAKGISSSKSPEDIFDILKDIIVGLIDPNEITVFVNSKKKIYQLIGKDQTHLSKASGSDFDIHNTSIGKEKAFFPLRTRNQTIGFMEIHLGKKLSSEMTYLIKGLAVFAAISIEKFELYEQLIEKEKIEKELQIARDIQQSFLLKGDIQVRQSDVAFINLTSSEVGGDYYDIIKLNDNETVYTINDISGHGIPASLLMAIFRTNFTYLINKNRDILETITQLNELISETTDANLYVTSFTAIIDTAEKTIRYINSGHNSPFIIRGEDVLTLDEGTLVLGMFPLVPYEIHQKSLADGDILVLFTDGVVEAENVEEEQFTTERFIELVKTNRHESAETIKKRIIDELKQFTRQEHFTDDVTFMIIKLDP